MNPWITPLAIALAVAVAATLVVRLRHAWNVKACRKELRDYKEQVVSLSDKIDALKERHKLLPHMDRGLAAPMRGETLAAYVGITERLDHHRAVWLQLMEVWEQAQTLLESEWILGSSRALTSRRKLREAAARTALTTMLGDCEAPLDRIEHAHEQAAADLKSYRDEDRRLTTDLESVVAAALSIAPYEPERSAAAALVEQSQQLLLGDPLATLRCLGEARGKTVGVRRRAATILEHAAAAGAMLKKLTDVQQAAAQRRLQGFLLQEEGSNPDLRLADVRQHFATIQESLNLANETAAGTLLSKASALIEQARQGLEKHVAAKLRCETEISVRQSEARRLADLRTLARGQQAELTRDFAAETWLGIAENLQRAQASLGAADQYLIEAVRHAAANAQNYVQAGQLLDKGVDHHKYAQDELAAIGHRLSELVKLRAAFQHQLGQLRGRSDRVHQLLQSSNADRALANERFRSARLTLDRLEDDSRLPRPDWTRLTARVKEIDTDLDRVEQLAKEDLQLARQAAAEISETEKVIADARSFHDQGITADVAAAESQLAQARGCLTAQGYEEAIRLANAAEQMAKVAHQDAIGRAQRRQQELESQRRAELMAVTPAPAMKAEAELE